MVIDNSWSLCDRCNRRDRAGRPLSLMKGLRLGSSVICAVIDAPFARLKAGGQQRS
jgi:hypothetical protein